MRHLDEYRDPAIARRLLDEIDRITTRPWSIMEVCGGQTHSILRSGIDQLLPDHIRLVHGPGCPVCVTPIASIDRALAIASRPEVVFCSFGDMLRVPGSTEDLLAVRSGGGDVRVVYSPLDAVRLAESLPDRQVVFFAIGFETTAPANAAAVDLAARRGVTNFSVLVSQVLVPPAMTAIATDPANAVDAFLAAGHVCAVMGTEDYEHLAVDLGTPIVVTGFEPLDVLDGIRRAVVQLETGTTRLDNAYERVVTASRDTPAREVIERVFEVCDRTWRGIGTIPASGWRLRPELARFDAELRFDVGEIDPPESTLCRAGEVLLGTLRPDDCPAFGTVCTPRSPLGAPMVSAEGACAAYHRYRRHRPTSEADDRG